MSIWKTIAGAAAMAAVVVMAPPARAAQPGVLVTGDNLPTNLDPHQIFDVPMMLYSLNAYDNLYRYQGNPPEAEALARAVAHRLGGRQDLGVQAPAGRQIPRRQRSDGGRRGLQLPARAGDRQGAVRRLQAGAEARQRHGAGQAHGALRARSGLRAVPVGRADRDDREPARREGEREQQRLGARPGSPRTPPAPAPTSSMPRPTVRSSGSISSATRIISSAGATTRRRPRRCRSCRRGRPRPASWRSSRAPST